MAKNKNQVWASTTSKSEAVETEDVLKKLASLGTEGPAEEVIIEAPPPTRNYAKEVSDLTEAVAKANDEIDNLHRSYAATVEVKEAHIAELVANVKELRDTVDKLTAESAVSTASAAETIASLEKKATAFDPNAVYAPLLCGHPQPCRGIRDTGDQYCRWCEDVNRLTLINRRLSVEQEQLNTQLTSLSSSNIMGEGALKKAKQTAYLHALEILKSSSSVDEAAFVLGKRLQDVIAGAGEVISV